MKREHGFRLPPEIDLLVRERRRTTEDELIRGYGDSVAPEPEKRPETGVIDENGFLHGEPISEGRTDRQRE